MKPFKLMDRLQSFKFAVAGISLLFKSQHNARIHLAVATSVITAGVILNLTAMEWALITIGIFSVLTAEAINTAIEFLADALHPDPHPLIGKSKDLAAASVLFSAIGAAIIGGIVFLPKLMMLLK